MKHTTKTTEGHLQKELPDTIYLQLHGDNEYVGNSEEIDFGDVTWSEDRMYPTDVEYAKVKSPWISVKERLPETEDEVLVLNRMKRSDNYFVSENRYANGDWAAKSAMYYEEIAWMPIPSFDEILEANKDVLERIKEKGGLHGDKNN